MIAIGCRRDVLVQLRRRCPRLCDIADLEIIFADTVIELRVDRVIHHDAVGIQPLHDVIELLARMPRLVQADEGLRKNGSLKEESKGVFFKHRLVNALAEVAGTMKINRLVEETRKRKKAQGDLRPVSVTFR